MKRLLLATAALAIAATSSLAMAQAQAETFKGTLIDNACFRAEMSAEDLSGHARSCALMGRCVESGYAIVTADRTVYKLDAASNEKVVEMLRASEQAGNLKVTATGTNSDGTLTVASITLDK